MACMIDEEGRRESPDVAMYKSARASFSHDFSHDMTRNSNISHISIDIHSLPK